MESSPALLTTPSRLRTPVRGFTMVEMLVSLGIITVISSIVLLGQHSFNKNLVLVDTAYTVAFTLRQAQTLGLSSRKFGTVQNAGYGTHFANGATTSFILFADATPGAPGTSQGGRCPGHLATTGLEARPGNCRYDGVDETVSTFNLNQGFKITRFCGTDTGGQQRCSGSALDSLDITFMRPSTQAVLLGTRAGALVELTAAQVYVTSPDGAYERCVTVTRVGQIAVATCP